MDVDGVPKLGILAAVQLDGSTSLYSVPHPGVVRRIMGVTPSDPKPLFCESSRVPFPKASCLASCSSGHRA